MGKKRKAVEADLATAEELLSHYLLMRSTGGSLNQLDNRIEEFLRRNEPQSTQEASMAEQFSPQREPVMGGLFGDDVYYVEKTAMEEELGVQKELEPMTEWVFGSTSVSFGQELNPETGQVEFTIAPDDLRMIQKMMSGIRDGSVGQLPDDAVNAMQRARQAARGETR